MWASEHRDVLSDAADHARGSWRAYDMPKYFVRYGVMRALSVLATRDTQSYPRGSRVIARTPRGLEAGEVLCEATDQILAHIKDPTAGQILREMSAEDENELAHMRAKEREEFDICRRYVDQVGLRMQLIDVEHLFGGERIIVYYLADDRVDFRELVRLLAAEFQTRIEMRQIGVRDEAKLLGDYGDCGKSVCCNTHLTEMPPVSMKMAKIQKATLDPTKISGRCGRLKCCLRYEYETYEQMQEKLPPMGAEIQIDTGRARVIGQEILTGQLLIETEDQHRKLIHAREVLTVIGPDTGKHDSGRLKAEKQDSETDSQYRQD